MHITTINQLLTEETICLWKLHILCFDRRAQLGRSIGSLWGNANNWNYAAKVAGFKVDKTPEVGAIFQTAAGPYGHVGVVEIVNPNGTITVLNELCWI